MSTLSNGPILPKTFAGYLHPLRSRYTEGSDQQRGLSASEHKKLKTDIALSKVLSPEQKKEANTIAQTARDMTVVAQKDGKITDTELKDMLNLAGHTVGKTQQGSAAAQVSFAGDDIAPDKLKTEFFKVAAATSYAPLNTKMEGGVKDSVGKPLKGHTLDQYVKAMKSGNAKANAYVAVAMDSALYKGSGAPMKYGDVFRIPEMEAIQGVSPIYFALVDNGGAFKDTGGSKIDICSDKAYTPNVNQSVTLHKVLHPEGRQLNVSDLGK